MADWPSRPRDGLNAHGLVPDVGRLPFETGLHLALQHHLNGLLGNPVLFELQDFFHGQCFRGSGQRPIHRQQRINMSLIFMDSPI